MNIIKIKFRGLGYGDIFQAQVFLYDKKNLIAVEQTKNGFFQISLEPEKVYHMIAISPNEILKRVFYVDKKRKIYCFSFRRALFYSKSIVTFHLTDFYYRNLPIKKGEIILE